MKNLPQIGLEIARLRKARGLSQQQLASLCGMGQSTLARFETGKVAEFGARKLLRLLEVMEREIDFVSVQRGFTLDDALAERQRTSRP